MSTASILPQDAAARNETEPRRVVIIDERTELVDTIVDNLSSLPTRVQVSILPHIRQPGDATTSVDWSAGISGGTVVLSPLRTRRRRQIVDVDYAKSVIQTCSRLGGSRFVLISSAEVYGADYANPGLMREKEKPTPRRPNGIAERWAEIEVTASEAFRAGELIVLRPCWTLTHTERDLISRLFIPRMTFPLAGHDPTIQLLSIDDMAAAVVAAISGDDRRGVYNVAPDGAISLRKAQRLTRSWRIPVPYTLQRWAHAARRLIGSSDAGEQLDFIRYSWTVSNQKIKDELGFRPQLSSDRALAQFYAPVALRSNGRRPENEQHDDFGMDRDYIQSCGRRQLGFMDKLYWRLETDGLEHFPKSGGGVLVGPHRGFMPFDGVMMVHALFKHTGRIPRFLIHPALVKFPHLATFLTRLGGIIACQENADYVLERQEVVGVFPEGIRGAFRMYEGGATYRLGKFRDDYVKIAVRHGVPIIPFVTIGPAETFPILAKIQWQWWKRHTHWPFFPITATWPLVPIPLPTKWAIRLLDPIPTDQYTPAAANERTVVRDLNNQVRNALQSTIDELRSRRKSVFYGSVFEKHRISAESREF